MPYYLSIMNDGLRNAFSNGDGYSVTLEWNIAYPSVRTNKIMYLIFMQNGENSIRSDFTDDLFEQLPSFVYTGTSNSTVINDLQAGALYHFGVRAAEYNPSFFNPLNLPAISTDLRVIPYSLLSSDMNSTQMTVPLIDSAFFFSSGVVRVGAELIQYSANNTSTNTLTVTQRGYNSTKISSHRASDGYDGISNLDPNVAQWMFYTDDQNTRVFECWNRFDVNNIPFNSTDGYRQVTRDFLNTDLSVSDTANINFPRYDYAGYHRTDPVLLLNGTCVGSYIGGEQFCADGYDGVGRVVRGLSIQDQNLQRLEMLLSVTGEPVILVKRKWTGITCSCMLPYNEYPEARCKFCLGTGVVVGWDQYFYPRYSDGKIRVRFDPTVDQLKAVESGLESEFPANCWTIAVPTLHNRDFIVRFDQDGNEEFRYEILNVTRNKLLLNNTGMQRFSVSRIRKNDVIYQVPLFKDTSLFPTLINTSVSGGTGAFAQHSHTIEISEKITSLTQINQITSTVYGHSHQFINGVQLPDKTGHVHTINIPSINFPQVPYLGD